MTNTAARRGHRFERQIADWLANRLADTRIDRRIQHGTNDRGDIAGLRTIRGADVVAELKDHSRLELGRWIGEAEVEAGNADAPYGVVIHKRRNHGNPADQYVTMTVAAFAWLLDGGPTDETGTELAPEVRSA